MNTKLAYIIARRHAIKLAEELTSTQPQPQPKPSTTPSISFSGALPSFKADLRSEMVPQGLTNFRTTADNFKNMVTDNYTKYMPGITVDKMGPLKDVTFEPYTQQSAFNYNPRQEYVPGTNDKINYSQNPYSPQSSPTTFMGPRLSFKF